MPDESNQRICLVAVSPEAQKVNSLRADMFNQVP